MTYEALLVMFLGAGLFALGVIGLLAGFFMSLFGKGSPDNRAQMIFVAGILALVSGAWLMNLAK